MNQETTNCDEELLLIDFKGEILEEVEQLFKKGVINDSEKQIINLKLRELYE